MRRLLLSGLVLLAGAAACSGPKGPAGGDLSAPVAMDLPGGPADQAMVPPRDQRAAEDLSLPPDLYAPPDIAGYPAGPYGYNLGETLSPAQWEGYVNPSAVGVASAQPYGRYGANDLRRSGARYALIYAADYF